MLVYVFANTYICGRLTVTFSRVLSEARKTLMAIDDKYDALDKARPEKGFYLPEELAALAAKCAFPGIADVLVSVWERFGSNAQFQRIRATSSLLVEDAKDLKANAATKNDLDAVKEAVQLALRHDANEFNDTKRERYVKIIGNALRSEKQVDDLASYIQDVEQLGERDFTALRVLNKVMNKPGDWSEKRSNLNSVVHPTVFIQRRQELAVQMAQAFGMNTDGSAFSREEGYDACNRLQAFGLAHEIELSARQVPIGEYSFRPSLRGLTLLKLVGEEVANWEKYNPPR